MKQSESVEATGGVALSRVDLERDEKSFSALDARPALGLAVRQAGLFVLMACLLLVAGAAALYVGLRGDRIESYQERVDAILEAWRSQLAPDADDAARKLFADSLHELADASYVVVYDGRGRVAAHTLGAWLPESLATAGTDGWGEVALRNEASGTPVRAIDRTLRTVGGTLRVGRDRRELEPDVLRALSPLLIVGTLLIPVGGLLVFVSSRGALRRARTRVGQEQDDQTQDGQIEVGSSPIGQSGMQTVSASEAGLRLTEFAEDVRRLTEAAAEAARNLDELVGDLQPEVAAPVRPVDQAQRGQRAAGKTEVQAGAPVGRVFGELEDLSDAASRWARENLELPAGQEERGATRVAEAASLGDSLLRSLFDEMLEDPAEASDTKTSPVPMFRSDPVDDPTRELPQTARIDLAFERAESHLPEGVVDVVDPIDDDTGFATMPDARLQEAASAFESTEDLALERTPEPERFVETLGHGPEPDSSGLEDPSVWSRNLFGT